MITKKILVDLFKKQKNRTFAFILRLLGNPRMEKFSTCPKMLRIKRCRRASSNNIILRKFRNKIKFRKLINIHSWQAPLVASMLFLAVMLIVFGIFKSQITSVADVNLSKVISVSLPGKPDINNLNFKNVERHEAPNAKSTVIYIPQLHKEPTSNAGDKTNDQALIVQKEISTMLKTLVDENHITYVMDETDNFGPMPVDKIEKVKTGFARISRLRTDVKSLVNHYLNDGGSADIAEAVEKNANGKIDSYERSIYLAGGAAVLAGTNSNAHVYGSQNPATIKEASRQLQDIVYMEQRINQLDPRATNNGNSGLTSNILSMLGNSNNSSSGSALQPIKDFAKSSNDTDMLSDIDKVLNESKVASSQTNYETASAVTSASAQSQVNPYASETNLPRLKQKYQTAYDKFMKVAKDQRSQEAADNLDQMMQSNGQTTAVLVMGLQHKDQLISILNKKSISVIVITPESENEIPKN